MNGVRVKCCYFPHAKLFVFSHINNAPISDFHKRSQTSLSYSHKTLIKIDLKTNHKVKIVTNGKNITIDLRLQKKNVPLRIITFDVSMNRLSYIVVDDKERDRQAVRTFIDTLQKENRLPGTLTFAGECTCASEAFEFLKSQHVDLMFLDIEMPDSNGFELIKALQIEGINLPMVILMSSFYASYIEHSMQYLYRSNVFNFLSKPIESAKIEDAIQIVFARKMELPPYEQPKTEIDKLAFIRGSLIQLDKMQNHTVYKKRRIAVSSIPYLLRNESLLEIYVWDDLNYTLTPKPYYTRDYSISTIEPHLPSQFVKIERSMVINLHYVSKQTDNKLEMLDGKELKIARRYLKAFNERVNELKIVFE